MTIAAVYAGNQILLGTKLLNCRLANFLRTLAGLSSPCLNFISTSSFIMSTDAYPLPPPTVGSEALRLNTQHELFLLCLNGSLFKSPFPPSRAVEDTSNNRPLRVADLGTGTGIWAREVASQYPEACVVGFDLRLPPSQEANLAPANVHFEAHDITLPWPEKGPAAGPFDFIHGRQLLINLHSPISALRLAWENLSPGGMIEFLESWNPMVSELETDGGHTDAPRTPFLVDWHRETVKASAAMGCDAGYAANLPGDLQHIGFVDIVVTDTKVPLGGWSADQAEPEDWSRKMDVGLRKMFVAGAPGMTSALFVKGLGWSEAKAAEYGARVVEEFQRDDLSADRIYARVRRVCGRKPLANLNPAR
ncbi:S-adenosyl-L-methionine-dependent methyltransferase [Diaporthe sp. PMI_573]|nr:S-adenosyl-L-methionine-dependent methyltransferase [Diaporthaceae sp. PMI_573]